MSLKVGGKMDERTQQTKKRMKKNNTSTTTSQQMSPSHLNELEQELGPLRKRHPKRKARKKKTLAQFVELDDELIEELEEEAYKE